MTFDEMIEFIIDRIEKGYANDPKDDGGATNWGISERAHPEWKGRMRELTKADAKKIYRSEYFTPGAISKYPSKMRLAVFDGAINHGVLTNSKLVQKALNRLGSRLEVDGVIGPMTLSALKKMNALTFLAAYCRERLTLYKKHPDYSWAGASWEYRLFLVCAAS